MAYSETKTRVWTKATANDGTFWEAEYNRLYDNFIAIVNNSGSAPTKDMEQLSTEVEKRKAIKYLVNADSPYTITDTEEYGKYVGNTSGGNIDVILPTLSANQERQMDFIHQVAGGVFNIDGEGAETIGELTDIDLSIKGNSLSIVGTSAGWDIIGENIACTWRADTHAGYGGGSFTLIPYLANVREDIGNLFTVANNNTEGLTITTKKSGYYSFKYGSRADGSPQPVGMSINTNQGTTGITAIDIDDSLGEIYLAASNGNVMTVAKWFALGQEIRPHNENAHTPVSNRSFFTASYLGG